MDTTDRGHVAVALVADLAAGVFEDDGRCPLGRSRAAVRLEDDRRVLRGTTPSRRGPKRLKIEKKNTHDLVS